MAGRGKFEVILENVIQCRLPGETDFDRAQSDCHPKRSRRVLVVLIVIAKRQIKYGLTNKF